MSGEQGERRSRTTRVAIIGAGFSGLCLGIRLKKAGIHSFTIYEQGEGLGGTWRDNTYPGAACDVPAALYCYSFEQNPDWSRVWAPQPEILAYMERCAAKYGLLPHIRFETTIASARFDADQGVWHLRTTHGEESCAEILVSGVGQLHKPYTPAIPGLDRFRGERFHSARWNHAYALEGKRVAVIGNAASAVQFVPEIAPRVAQLHVFQRSPNWMLPKQDREYSEREKRLFRRFPLLAKLVRLRIWLSFEMMWSAFHGRRLGARRIERMAREHLEAQIADPELRRVLVPDYPIGGKRLLISDDYYPALARENVELVTDAIDHITEDAIVTRGGRHIPVDAIILATGFDTHTFLAPMQVQGLEGRSLESEWKDGAEAYLGLSAAGFPNFFMMYGPNTNLGNNSIIFMIECQAAYILDCIRQIQARGLEWIDLRREVQDAYNKALQRELRDTVWVAPDQSWYKTASGRITNNWSGTTSRYWWKTHRADLSRYHQKARVQAQV